jgi:pentatricopeptide repeat protein
VLLPHVRVLREIAFASATREGIAFGSTWDVRVVNSLVDMYAKCGSMDDAWRVFNKMPSRDVVTWTAVLGGCALHGHGKEALKHFKWMCKEGVQPDDISFISLLSACSHAGLVDEGMRCYASMVTDCMISAKLEITPVWSTFLVVLAIHRRQRIWSWQCTIYRMWLHGWLCSVFAEFMVNGDGRTYCQTNS